MAALGAHKYVTKVTERRQQRCGLKYDGMAMKILITGGTGLIGTPLIKN